MAYEDLIQRYFPSSAWEEALQVMALESGFNPYAKNDSSIENSYGLFQINTRAHGGDFNYWSDPERNVAKAAELWRNAGGTFARDWVNAYNIIHGGTGRTIPSGSFSGSAPQPEPVPQGPRAGSLTRLGGGGSPDALAAYLGAGRERTLGGMSGPPRSPQLNPTRQPQPIMAGRPQTPQMPDYNSVIGRAA